MAVSWKWLLERDPNQIIAFFTVVLAAVGIATWFIMRQSARRQLRAYLGFGFRWFDGKDDHNMPLALDKDGRDLTAIFVSNHGQTPAHDVRFRGTCRVLAEADAEKAVRDSLSPEWHVGDEAPRLCDPRTGEAYPLYYLVRGKEAHREPDPLNKEHIYAYGRVEYTDVFRAKHDTTFCAFHDPDYGAISGGPWVPAPNHNTAT